MSTLEDKTVELRRERRREANRKWRAAHPERIKQQKAKQYRANRAKYLAASKKYRDENRDRYRAVQAKAYASPEGRAKHLVFAAKKRARKKNLPFNLDWRAVETVIFDGHCEATGLPFILDRDTEHAHCPLSPSLDRIDPRKGYTKDNVRVVVTQFNVAKGEWSEAAFERVAKAYLEHKQHKQESKNEDTTAV